MGAARERFPADYGTDERPRAEVERPLAYDQAEGGGATGQLACWLMPTQGLQQSDHELAVSMPSASTVL